MTAAAPAQHAATGVPGLNPKGRRAQALQLYALRRGLNDLINNPKPCHCPPDCRGLSHRTTHHGAHACGSNPGPGPQHQQQPASSNNNADNANSAGNASGACGQAAPQASHRPAALADSAVLARATGATPLGQPGAQLRMSLQVHSDPRGSRSRLGYRGELSLAGHEPGQPERHVGYMTSWRVARHQVAGAGGGPEPWIQEWLLGDLGPPGDEARPLKETFRLLFDAAGQVLPAVNVPRFRDLLADRGTELVFIDTVLISLQDERTGSDATSGEAIAAEALNLLHRLSTNGTLPAWYNIPGPVVFLLRAGMPSDDDLSAVWRGQHPQQAGESAQAYLHRIAGIIQDGFVGRYRYTQITADQHILAKVVAARDTGTHT